MIVSGGYLVVGLGASFVQSTFADVAHPLNNVMVTVI